MKEIWCNIRLDKKFDNARIEIYNQKDYCDLEIISHLKEEILGILIDTKRQIEANIEHLENYHF